MNNTEYNMAQEMREYLKTKELQREAKNII